MKKKYLQILLTAILIIIISTFMLAQRQAGSIWGTVTDDQGAALPGVGVTIRSPSMMGTQSCVTREDGSYRFPPNLPPGKYVVRIELVGFQTIERPGIVVGVGTNVKVDFQMELSTIQEEITVTAPSPVVDIKSAKQSSLITSDAIENIPVARDLFDLVQTAPSVTADYLKMISIHGASVQQSRFVLDGVDMVDPMHGYVSAEIAFDAVAEVEMAFSGHGADISKVSAGYINVVTKSGGNTFSGSLTGVYIGESLINPTIPASETDALGLGGQVIDKYSYDTSLTFGGPIIKDKVWFFLSPRFTKYKRTSNSIAFTDAFGRDWDKWDYYNKEFTGFLKLTAQITKKIKFMSMIHYLNATRDPSGPRTPLQAWSRNTWFHENPLNLNSKLSYIIDQNTYLEAQFSWLNKGQWYLNYHQRGLWESEPDTRDRFYGTSWGTQWWNEDHRRKNLDLSLTMTKYLDDFLGANHEIRIGTDYTRSNVRTSHFHEDPYVLRFYKDTPWNYHNTTPYMGNFNVANEGPDWDSASQLNIVQRYGLFFQDTISMGRLNLNIGLRYDSTHYTKPEEIRKGWVDVNHNGLINILLPEVFPTTDTIAPEIKDLVVWSKLQPRIGLTYDLFGDGRTALKATYSRYGESVIAAMFRGIHPFDAWRTQANFTWWDNNQNGILDLPPVDDYFLTNNPRLDTDPASLSMWIDPDMSSPYIDEVTVGIEREIFKDFRLDLRFIYRDKKNIPELIDTGNPLDSDMWIPYTVTDPGADGLPGTGDEQQITVFALRKDAPPSNNYVTNIKELRRKYWGIELVMFKRMSNNWQFSGSVTYSKNYGNFGGGYGDIRLNRGIFLNPNNLINLWGRLTHDRPLIVKLMGTVKFPHKILLSAFYRHYDGATQPVQFGWGPIVRTLTVYFPSTVEGYETKVPSVTVKAEPPGSKRFKAEDVLDLRLEKEFSLGFGRLGVYVDVFNVLGYSTLRVDINDGGYIYADGSFSSYPQYGRAISAQGLRSFQFTLRFRF